MIQKYSNQYLTMAPLTSEQIQANALLQTDIKNAVLEHVSSFVTGGVTDEGWNDFVAIFEDMNVADYVQMYQDAIDGMDIE